MKVSARPKPEAEAGAEALALAKADPRVKAVVYEKRMMKERVLQDADFVLRFEVRSLKQRSYIQLSFKPYL